MAPNENETEESEKEEQDSEEESDESEEPIEPNMQDVLKELAELKKQLEEQKKPAEPAESDSKDKPKVDPMHVDYAEFLKKQLGKTYPKEFDKLPLEIRIPSMKAVLEATQSIKPLVREGISPKGTPVTPTPIPGQNFKELAKKIREGK